MLGESQTRFSRSPPKAKITRRGEFHWPGSVKVFQSGAHNSESPTHLLTPYIHRRNVHGQICSRQPIHPRVFPLLDCTLKLYCSFPRVKCKQPGWFVKNRLCSTESELCRGNEIRVSGKDRTPNCNTFYRIDRFPGLRRFSMKLSDRRLAQRFRLSIPLYIRAWKSQAAEQKVESVNVSECGAYFETDTPPREGAMIQVRLEMPNEITGNPTAEWRCTGKVTRIERVNSSRHLLGVSIRFDYYEVCRPEVSMSALSLSSLI